METRSNIACASRRKRPALAAPRPSVVDQPEAYKAQGEPWPFLRAGQGAIGDPFQSCDKRFHEGGGGGGRGGGGGGGWGLMGQIGFGLRSRFRSKHLAASFWPEEQTEQKGSQAGSHRAPSARDSSRTKRNFNRTRFQAFSRRGGIVGVESGGGARSPRAMASGRAGPNFFRPT